MSEPAQAPESMDIAVVGCGYVGLVSAVGLASVGHRVVGVEIDPERRERLETGRAPFHEPGLDPLLRLQLNSGRLRFSDNLDDAADASVVLLAVQTPPKEDGSIELGFLGAAATDLHDVLAAAPSRDRVVAVRSTVVPGTIESLVAPALGDIPVASNPEFLREGSALRDFLRTDRVVVGCDDPRGRELLAAVYEPLGAPIIFTSPATAELAKYASNAFLATLVSFSNEIAHICEALPGVDVEDVLGIVHADRRWRAPNGDRAEILSYLRAGCGYGGSCLPKDLSALIAAATARGEQVPLLAAVREVNEGQPQRVTRAAEEALGGLSGRTVAVLGVAFKTGTDDLRSSPGLRMVDELLARGASVRVYDPLVTHAALSRYAEAGVEVSATLDAAISDADACVLTTAAPEIAALPELIADSGRSGLVVVDARRVLDPNQLADAVYVGVGMAPPVRSAAVSGAG
jgi:nucleotide sugar dehydrogenase